MDGEVTASYFDQRAPQYVNADWHVVYARRLVESAGLSVGQRVLDVATGTGFAAMTAARAVGSAGQVVGVDISAGMLTQAERLRREAGLDNLSYLESDATALTEFENESFDAVLCSAGMLYLPVRVALSAWHRVLKPGVLVGFSAMRAGYAAVAEAFRRCAAEFGIQLPDPHAALGDEARCRQALTDAGYHPDRMVADSVQLPESDPEHVWHIYATSPHYPQLHTLSSSDLEVLRQRFTATVERLNAEHGADFRRAPVLYAYGRKT